MKGMLEAQVGSAGHLPVPSEPATGTHYSANRQVPPAAKAAYHLACSIPATVMDEAGWSQAGNSDGFFLIRD